MADNTETKPMSSSISSIFLKHGFLLQPDVMVFLNCDKIEIEIFLDIFQTLRAPKIVSFKFFEQNKEKITTILNSFIELKKFDEAVLNNIKRRIIEKLSHEVSHEEKEKQQAILPLQYSSFENNFNIDIIKPRKVDVKDFIDFFRDRYEFFKELLKDRKELSGLISLDKLPKNNQNLSVIGMVISKRETKNKNIVLSIEDGKGQVTVLINKNRTEVYEKAQDIVEDEVIGIKGFGNKEIIFASEIVFPEIPPINFNKKCNIDTNILFISDIHVGSNKFLESNFKNFIKWVNGDVGDSKQKDKAKKVSHIFILGDIVDGVGIYPSQEEELVIKDIKQQYEAAFELFDEIRKDIKLIFIPGNHDGVRIAEPQIFGDYAKALTKLENAELLPNPCYYNLYGYRILLYHGYSFDYYANNVYSLKQAKAYESPDVVLKFLLTKRHLAPTHGSTLYTPSQEDFFVIKKVPDIFAASHMHKTATSYFKNIALIATSCWQSRTAFQEKFGHMPDPCKVPMFNTKTKKVNLLDFS